MSAKVALLLAAGMVVSAATISFAPIWTWQAGTDTRLDRLEAAADRHDRRLDRIDASVREQAEKASKGLAAVAGPSEQTAKHLGQLDAAVRDIQKQLAPLKLELAAAPPPRPAVPANSVAVLPFRAGDRETESYTTGLNTITAGLVVALAEQPKLRVTPMALSAGKKDDKGGAADPRAVGRELGVRHVATASAIYTRSTSPSSFLLHIEVFEVESGAVVWAGQRSVPYESAYRSDGEAHKAFAEVAQKINEKIAEKIAAK